jgi:hypothetical protein
MLCKNSQVRDDVCARFKCGAARLNQIFKSILMKFLGIIRGMKDEGRMGGKRIIERHPRRDIPGWMVARRGERLGG